MPHRSAAKRLCLVGAPELLALVFRSGGWLRSDWIMPKHAFSTPAAPKPAGPYSQGIEGNGMIFVAGQGGIDPASGELLDGIAAQTERALENIAAILEEAGTSLANAVKVSVFLADFAEFEEMNEVYKRLVPEPRPARTTVQSALPPPMRVEIDAIALTSP